MLGKAVQFSIFAAGKCILKWSSLGKHCPLVDCLYGLNWNYMYLNRPNGVKMPEMYNCFSENAFRRMKKCHECWKICLPRNRLRHTVNEVFVQLVLVELLSWGLLHFYNVLMFDNNAGVLRHWACSSQSWVCHEMLKLVCRVF